MRRQCHPRRVFGLVQYCRERRAKERPVRWMINDMADPNGLFHEEAIYEYRW